MSNSGKPNDRECDDFVERHLSGELTEPEQEQLAGWLDSDASFRKDFVQRVTCDTELTEVIRGDGDRRPELKTLLAGKAQSSKRRSNTVMRTLLAVSAMAILILSVLLVHETSTPNVIATDDSGVPSSASIARISGLSGSLIWTGDRGEIVRNVSVGTEVSGGTIEGLAPDSWFELQFNDASTVMISGTSTLTFSDFGQKKLRLREGRLSANVVPQHAGKPMLIHTRSTVLEVLGTQFDVEANQTSTSLNVNEGKVRLRRLSDGNEIDVPAQHRVVAEDESDLIPQRVQASVNHWKSQLNQQSGGYGKWLPATSERPATQKAIALIPSDNQDVVLYLLSIPVTNVGNSSINVLSDSRFVVRGRLNAPARVFFGIGLSYDNGEFAGKFRGDLGDGQPVAQVDPDGRFEVVYRLSDFSLDPCVLDRKDELAKRPDGLVLNEIWCFTHTDEPPGLEVTDVELLPPRI